MTPAHARRGMIVGKKKRNQTPPEEQQPGIIDKITSNRLLTVGAGFLIVALFAGVAILVVTLLGGDDLGANAELDPPAPIAAATFEPSEVADVFSSKTWDDMSAAEREQVEKAVRNAFDEATFRASSQFVKAIDVSRDGGATLLSRQYVQIETPSGKPAFAEQMLFHCVKDGTRTTYRYTVSPIQSEFSDQVDEFATQPAWDGIVENTYWADAADLGFKESASTGRRLHGLELRWAPDPDFAAEGRPTQYWFDAESALLMERGTIFEGDDASTKANWYYLSYDQPPPLVIPADLEQPECVKDLVSRSGF